MTDQVVTTSTPTWSSVTPVGGYDRNYGFGASDAALVLQGNNFLSAQNQIYATANGYAQNTRDTLEAKFDLERSIKDNQFQMERSIKETAVAAERLERENQNEVKKQISAEADKTRALIMDIDRRRDERDDNDRRFAKLEAAIAAITVSV